MNRRTSSVRLPRTLVGLATLTAVLAFSAVAPAQPQTSKAPRPCGFVVKGAPWTYKSQKGTAYTVVVIGVSCSTARKWVSRLTRERAAFDLKPVPTGWHCSTTGGITTGLTKTGQCTTPGGGIVEWLPKLNK